MKHVRAVPVCIAMLVGAAAPASADSVVSTSPFESVELDGGGHVTLKHGAVQQVRLVRGSTAYTSFVVEDGRKLRIDACNSNCPDRYDLDIEIVTPTITALAISGGGQIDALPGFPAPGRLALAVEGGGSIDARGLTAGAVTAAVDGGGNIQVKAKGKLTAAINGGGKIRYWGNPEVTQAVDGGGDVERGE